MSATVIHIIHISFGACGIIKTGAPPEVKPASTKMNTVRFRSKRSDMLCTERKFEISIFKVTNAIELISPDNRIYRARVA